MGQIFDPKLIHFGFCIILQWHVRCNKTIEKLLHCLQWNLIFCQSDFWRSKYGPLFDKKWSDHFCTIIDLITLCSKHESYWFRSTFPCKALPMTYSSYLRGYFMLRIVSSTVISMFHCIWILLFYPHIHTLQASLFRILIFNLLVLLSSPGLSLYFSLPRLGDPFQYFSA